MRGLSQVGTGRSPAAHGLLPARAQRGAVKSPWTLDGRWFLWGLMLQAAALSLQMRSLEILFILI